MKKLNLPAYDFLIRKDNKRTQIFDAVRGKYLVLTPEEWVRQHLVRFLIEEKNYPKGLIAIEKGLRLNGLQKRADVLVYNKAGKPVLLIECKAPNVKINQAAFDQIGRYNISFRLPYLLVSNGMSHYCAKINFEAKDFSFLKDIPSYEELD
jgi:type I site-specific restriction endonuclease